MHPLQIRLFNKENSPPTPDVKKEWTASYVEHPILWAAFHDIHSFEDYIDFSDFSTTSLNAFAQDLYSKTEDIPVFVRNMILERLTPEERYNIHPSFRQQSVEPPKNMTPLERFTYLTTHSSLSIFHDELYLQELVAHLEEGHEIPLTLFERLAESPYELPSRLEQLFTSYPIIFERWIPESNRDFWIDKIVNPQSIDTSWHYMGYIIATLVKAPYNVPFTKIEELHKNFSMLTHPETSTLQWHYGSDKERALFLTSCAKHYKTSSLRGFIAYRYPQESEFFDNNDEIFIQNAICWLHNNNVQFSETSLIM